MLSLLTNCELTSMWVVRRRNNYDGEVSRLFHSKPGGGINAVQHPDEFGMISIFQFDMSVRRVDRLGMM